MESIELSVPAPQRTSNRASECPLLG